MLRKGLEIKKGSTACGCERLKKTGVVSKKGLFIFLIDVVSSPAASRPVNSLHRPTSSTPSFQWIVREYANAGSKIVQWTPRLDNDFHPAAQGPFKFIVFDHHLLQYNHSPF
jgi:hypothetical protein